MDSLSYRKVGDNIKLEPMVEIVSGTIKSKNKEIDAIKKELKKEIESDNMVLANIAVIVFSLDKTINRYLKKLEEVQMKPLIQELKISRNKLMRELETADVTITDLTNQTINDDILEIAEVIGWLKGEREEEYVIETYEPLVKRKDLIIHLAKITGGTKNI